MKVIVTYSDTTRTISHFTVDYCRCTDDSLLLKLDATWFSRGRSKSPEFVVATGDPRGRFLLILPSSVRSISGLPSSTPTPSEQFAFVSHRPFSSLHTFVHTQRYHVPVVRCCQFAHSFATPGLATTVCHDQFPSLEAVITGHRCIGQPDLPLGEFATPVQQPPPRRGYLTQTWLFTP